MMPMTRALKLHRFHCTMSDFNLTVAIIQFVHAMFEWMQLNARLDLFEH